MEEEDNVHYPEVAEPSPLYIFGIDRSALCGRCGTGTLVKRGKVYCPNCSNGKYRFTTLEE